MIATMAGFQMGVFEPDPPIMAYFSTGVFSISNYNPTLIYTATLTTGSGTATLNTSTGRYTLSAADSRFSVVAKYGAGAPESDADFMERKAPIPYTYRVATGPYACHGCSAPLGHAAPCCAGGGCGCGTFHTAGAFAYTGFWACCAPGYDETGYYSFTSTGYTWSGADYTNGSGEWYKIT